MTKLGRIATVTGTIMMSLPPLRSSRLPLSLNAQATSRLLSSAICICHLIEIPFDYYSTQKMPDCCLRDRNQACDEQSGVDLSRLERRDIDQLTHGSCAYLVRSASPPRSCRQQSSLLHKHLRLPTSSRLLLHINQITSSRNTFTPLHTLPQHITFIRTTTYNSRNHADLRQDS